MDCLSKSLLPTSWYLIILSLLELQNPIDLGWFSIGFLLMSRGFLMTARALAAQVTQEHLENGLVYPPFQSIRKISANIAAAVADKAYELGTQICAHINSTPVYTLY